MAGSTLTTAIRARLSTFAAGIPRPFTDSRRRTFLRARDSVLQAASRLGVSPNVE